MLSKSKLQNAKQKISKLKEKYSNISNVSKGDDDIIGFFPNTEGLKNNKPDIDQSTLKLFNKTISPVNEIKSPRIEITTSLLDMPNVKHDKGEEINSQTLGSSHNLIDSHSNLSPSEQSCCSKITNKSLKTESLVISELSNQFENICFLSSSSDEENTTRLHQYIFPQTARDLDNSLGVGLPLLQTSLQRVDGPFESEENDDMQKREESSSEMSEVQSDVNSTVFSGKEDSVQFKPYSHPTTVEANNSVEKINMDSENSYKSESLEKKQTPVSYPECEVNFSSRTQDNSFTEFSDKKLLTEIKPSQLSKNIVTKHKCINNKTTEHTCVSRMKPDPKLKHNNSRKRISSSKGGEVRYSSGSYIERSPTSEDGRDVHERVFSLPKKPRRKDPKRSNTLLNHSTNLKPSTNRPILKSCVLVNNDECNEENKLPRQTTFLAKREDCGCEDVISELLWSQVQLTRHFINSHHQMYLTCCQAVKILNEKYNSCNSA